MLASDSMAYSLGIQTKYFKYLFLVVFILSAVTQPVNAVVPVFEVMYVEVLFKLLIKNVMIDVFFLVLNMSYQKMSCLSDDLFTALSCTVDSCGMD